jgi:hypothetical protein
MSTESLINNIDYNIQYNIEYNVKMDQNISILSNEGTIPPEDLSYIIYINNLNEEISTSNDIAKNTPKCNCLVLKINILIISSIIILLCILYL